MLRLSTLPEDLNGRLSNHDGGLEWSIDELVSTAVKADAVVFPTDCISRRAAKSKMPMHETTK